MNMYVLLVFEILLVLILYIAARDKYKNYRKQLGVLVPLRQDTGKFSSATKKMAGLYDEDIRSGEHLANTYTVKNGNSFLRCFLPAGLHLLKLVNCRYSSKYMQTLEMKIKPLVGQGQARLFLEIHMARKVVMLIFTAIFLTFVATQAEVDTAFGLFSGLLLFLMFYIPDKQLEKQLKERNREIQLEFPEFLNKLVLLIDAGMTIQAAIRKIVRDSRKENPLYFELVQTINEINSGKSETEAFELFARRCSLQEVTLFTATLLQNLKKGNSELVPLLRVQAGASWENRKNIARKLGEEASTKLVFPMILIFIAILIMVVSPALFQLNF
jgi:tight adherence protein C